MKKIILFIIISLTTIINYSCIEDKKTNAPSDGQIYLKNWAENIIIPSYDNYKSAINQFYTSLQLFNTTKNESNFKKVQEDFISAYKALQHILLFDFGHAENVYLSTMANQYPTKPKYIEENIDLIEKGKENEIDLSPSSETTRQISQGFPALDYLLFEKSHTLEYYKTGKGKFAAVYMLKLVQALKMNIETVVSNWKRNKDKYINDTDNSVSGSYSQTVNAFIRVYEKDIRANKVGYAAGAIKAQNNKPAPKIIEAYYNAEISKELLTIALHSSRDFFNGKHFNSDEVGESLASLLKKAKYEKLVKDINEQYDKIDKEIASISVPLKELALTDNQKMRNLYNKIQKNVANYKTKMMTALNISIGYQDTDGD